MGGHLEGQTGWGGGEGGGARALQSCGDLKQDRASWTPGNRADWLREPSQTFQELIDWFCVVSEDVV